MAQTPEASITIKVFNQEFNKEMKEMGREAGRLRQEFQLQEEQMKHSASETEKLQAKMQYLTQQQELAARRVRETERQYAAVAAQYGENSQAAQEMSRRLTAARIEEQRFANQIHETTEALQDQRRTLADVGESMQEVGGKMKDAGEKLSTAVTLPLIGLGAAAVKSVSDMDAALGKLSATTDRTVEDTQEMQEAAKDLWKNAFGEDINDAAEAIAVVDRNLGDLAANAAEVKQLTEQAFILRDAFGYDIQESSRAAAALMNNFGISGQEAFDMIATAAQKGGDFSQELIDTISEYSTYFGAAGFSAERMFDIMLAGAKNGAWNMDKVGDAVKEFNIRAKDGSKTTAEGFAAIGFKADEMAKKIANGGEEGEKAFIATMSALAAMPDKVEQNAAGVALFGTQWEDLESTVMQAMANSEGYLGDFSGKTAEMGNEMRDNFGTRLTTTLRTLQEALLPIGETIVGMVEKALPAIERMATAFGNMSPLLQQIVLIVAAVAAALGPLLVVIGMVANGIGVVIAWLAPLIASIAEVGGLIAFLSTKFTALFAAITGPIGIVIAAVVALIAIFIALYKNNEEFRNKVNEIWASIKASFKVALDFIMNIVSSVMKSVTAFFSSQLAVIRQFWDKNGKDILNLVKSVFQNGIWPNIKMVMGLIKGIFQTVWPIVTGGVKVAWGLIQATIKNALTIALGAIQFFLKIFKGDWSGAFNTIKETASKIMQNIVSTFKGINLLQIGKDIINGLVRGIGSMAGAVKQRVAELASNIPAWAKEILGIHSPSRVMAEVGKDTGRGLAVGLESSRKTVKSSTTNLLDDLVAFNGRVAKEMQKSKKKQKEITDAQIESSKQWYEKKKYYNQLSLADELKYFEYLAKLSKNNTKERAQAEKEIYRVKKEINDKLTSINNEFVQKMNDANKRLSEGEKALSEEYFKAIEDRTKSLVGFAGIFDEVQSKSDVTGQQLIDNLQGQVNTFAAWSNNIRRLSARGIDKGLLEELRAMGPSAAGEIAALTTLSSAELEEYSNLWKEKNRLAKTQAVSEMEGLRIETNAKIKQLRADTAKELELYKKEWTSKIKEINTLSSNEFVKMNTTMSDIGKNSIQGLIKGMAQMTGPLIAQAKAIANTVTNTIKGTLKIKSPSRVMIDLGEDTGEGAIIGLENKLASIKKIAAELANTFVPDSSSPMTASGAISSREMETLQLAFQKQTMPSHITVISQLDGYEVARNQYPFIDEMLVNNYERSRRSRGV